MTYVVRVGVLLVAIVVGGLGCCEQQDKEADGKDREPPALVRFQAAVRKEVFPRLDDLSVNEILQMSVQLAEEHLAPAKDELIRHATGKLGRFPKAEPLDRDRYESLLGEDMANQCIAVLRGEEMTPGAEVTRFHQLAGWDPLQMARICRSTVLVRTLGVTQFGKRTALESVAPPIIKVQMEDAATPAVCFHMPDEVFIVHLELVEGVFLPSEVEWLHKKKADELTE